MEATEAARRLEGTLGIVSAGLGFVPGELFVPSYGLTVVSGQPDNVLERISPRVSPKDWWDRLSALSPLNHSVAKEARATSGLIVVALPESYLEMISGELAGLPKAVRSRLRIMTGTMSERVDPRLRAWLMPYDDRLDGPDSPLPGTRSDFATRAARHFVEAVAVVAPKADAAVHAASVGTLLSKWRRPRVILRQQKTDSELLQLLRRHWKSADGRSGRLLRVLRDDLRVSCEQGRLARLVAQIRDERRERFG